ncbi:MAG: class I SAM-dependent methyltransferase [Candidatus Thorarchaeota archaeon]|jgi:ubiquinone/menaquinone biosynthesis C-methylase UbiE
MSEVTGEKIRHIYSSSAHNYQMLLKFYRGLGVNLAKWREEAIQRLPDLQEPRILDVSTGTGANIPLLAARYPDYSEIVGIDYTPEMLKQAVRRSQDHGLKNIKLQLGDARGMSKDLDGCFDLVMSSYSLSIIPESQRVLKEMEKLVCKTGYVMLLDCQKFKGLLRLYNPIAIFLSTRLGGNSKTYSVPVSELASNMFRPVSRRLMYSGMFYEDLYRSKKS